MKIDKEGFRTMQVSAGCSPIHEDLACENTPALALISSEQ